MANITEKDIITHLKEQISYHQSEAKRIESILSAFTHSPTSKVKSEAAQEAGEQPLKVKAAKPTKAAKALQVPNEYQPTLTLNSKIAYALSQLGSGSGEEIAAKIAELQPGLDAAKVKQQISGVLSTLRSNGQLSAVKDGRKDKFSLSV